MLLQEVRTGAKVQFINLRHGKKVGLESDIYTIKDINFNDWGVCEVLLECDGDEVYTNHEAIELASADAIKEWEALQKRDESPTHYEQITIFDLLEVQ